MNKYKLIAFDMDGTLLNDNKKILPGSIKAIEDAIKLGKQVVLCTGRCLPELEEYFPVIPSVRYIIGVSGGYVYDIKEKKMIYENAIAPEIIFELLEIAGEEDCMPHLLTTKSIVAKDDVKNMSHFGMGVYQPMYEKVTTQVDDLYTYYKEHAVPVAKINFYHSTPEGRERMLEKAALLPIETVRAEQTSLECSARNVTKGTGLIKLCEYLGIDISETIAVGDADNDLNVLSTAGLSIAMGNANENVKKIADVIVNDNNHDGCKEAIEKYLFKLTYYPNTAFMYIPFSYGEPDGDTEKDFNYIKEKFDQSEDFVDINPKNKYMYKYITDKNKQLTLQYRLTAHAYNKLGLKKEEFYTTVKEHNFKGNKIKFAFQILDIDIFYFYTNVGIAVYRINFENNDPYYVSSCQYYMKKASRELFQIGDKQISMLGEMKNIITTLGDIPFNYFFYANEETERANFLTIIDLPDRSSKLTDKLSIDTAKKEYHKELYYLRNCYSDEFTYFENADRHKRETLRADENICWGISNEDAVCTTVKERDKVGFIEDTFYTNFNIQYSFMYVLLLHQKYVLYNFLTKIGIGYKNDLKILEKYHDDFYEFETDFVFSKITEVVQYQQLYDRIRKVFGINDMYQDVREPLTELAERKRKDEQKKNEERAKTTERLLFFLAVLGIFSAFVDSYDFIGEFYILDGMTKLIKVLQLSIFVGILIVMIYFIVDYMKKRKKDK